MQGAGIRRWRRLTRLLLRQQAATATATLLTVAQRLQERRRRQAQNGLVAALGEQRALRLACAGWRSLAHARLQPQGAHHVSMELMTSRDVLATSMQL
jgi:hypothetical protein